MKASEQEVATTKELEAIKRRLAREAAEEARSGPDWRKLARKSNKGLKKSRSGKKRQDALDKRLPGAGWTRSA